MTGPASTHHNYDLFTAALQQELQATQFTNTRIPPRRMQQIISDMGDAFAAFHTLDESSAVHVHGQHLAQYGLSHQSIAAVVQVVYRAGLADRSEDAADFALSNKYATALLHGYMQEREAQLLREQERTHLALERARTAEA